MTQPARPTASTITDQQLDQLYAQRDAAVREAALAERHAERNAADARAVMTRAEARVAVLEKRIADEEEASRRLLAQRQEMAAERYAWQERGDRAEAALERARALATRWAIMRAYGSAAYELRKALDENSEHAESVVHRRTSRQATAPGHVDETATAALERVRHRCQQVRDREGPAGLINASQILGLLSPTWPDGNHEAAPGDPS